MRLFEFDNQLIATVKNNLTFHKNLSNTKKINMTGFLNSLQKQHILMTYDSLKALIDKNPDEFENFIKDINAEEITLDNTPEELQAKADQSSEEDKEDEAEKDSIEDKIKSMSDKATKTTDKVDSMAKSAAKRRA